MILAQDPIRSTPKLAQKTSVVVSVERVTKVFHKITDKTTTSVVAVNDLSFQVHESEFVTLVGSSGCGKTTTLRMVAGLIPPTSGQVVVKDAVVKGPGNERAMVFQDFSLLPWRTCLGNVEFALELRKVEPNERRERALKVLELVDLNKWANYYPSELSGGMQQRVGIARALVVNPEILLMDEPFGSLDAITRTQMQVELASILAKDKVRRTVIFVTHSIDEALLLSDRVLVLAKGGKLIEDITPAIHGQRGHIEMLLDPEFVEIKRHLMKLLEESFL